MNRQAAQYFADNASSASEVERLGGICKVYDAWTQEQFLSAGLKAGHRVAEIGFGTGSMLRWLSKQVGTDGIAHGYDLTPRFIGGNSEFLERNHIQLFQHNIQDTELPKAEYDFVYCRLLLAHLIDPKTAISNMLVGLKRGGKLIAMDYDSLPVKAEPTSEGAVKFNHAAEKINQDVGAQGLMSVNYGKKMAEQMRELGLNNVSNQVQQSHYIGGDFEALLSAEGIDLISQARPELAEFAHIMSAKMRTPGFAYRDVDMHCAIGIKD